MKSLKYIIMDILKCMLIGSAIAIGVSLITGLITILVTWGNIGVTLDYIKFIIFLIGSLGLLLAGGAFAQREGTRPFIYDEQWKTYFKKLNIGFVILFICSTIILWGVLVYNLIFFKVLV